MALLEVRGTALQVTRQGPAPDPGIPVVVCLHGLILADSSSFYFTLAPSLAERAHTVLIDLRGHGRSATPPTGYALADAAEDVVAVLDQLGLHRPVEVVGNSYGGAVALTLADAHPDRVAALVLVEAHVPRPGWGATLAAELDLSARHLDPDQAMAQLGIRSRRRAERLVARASRLFEDTTLVDDVRREPGLSTVQLARLTAPALCVYGTRSDLVPVGRRLHAELADSELHELDAGHSLIAERTTELRPLVNRWLDRRTVGERPPTIDLTADEAPAAASERRATVDVRRPVGAG